MKTEVPMRLWAAITTSVLAMLLTGCVGGGPAYQLNYEVRRSQSHPIPLNGNLVAVDARSIGGHHLSSVKRANAGDYTVLEGRTLTYEGRRRAVVIKPAGEPSQVFVLPIPFMPKNSDWSEWRKPDYADATPAPDLRFLHEGRPKTDILPVPANFFEMRFKLHLWDSRPNAPQQP